MMRLLVKIVDCFFLLRVPLLVPVWTVLMVGWITGSETCAIGGGVFNCGIAAGRERMLWLSLVFFSCIVSSIYVMNQIADIESDRINHKLFILPRRLISVRMAWVCAATCAVAGLAGAAVFLDTVMVAVFTGSLLLGVLYNQPPVALKNRAWGGVIANFIGHGVVTFLVGWYAADFAAGLHWHSVQRGLLGSLTAGFANAAVFLTTTIPDADGDASTGKRTFCVAYGEKKTAIAAAVSCALALLFSFTLQYNSWVMIIPSALSLVLFTAFIISTRQEFAFKTFRWPVFILSVFVVVFIPLYGMIILVTLLISRVYYKLRFNYDYPTLKSR